MKKRNALYDRIGTTYDATRQADPYILSRLLHHLAPSRDGLYLDVGCGTGNYTGAMARARVNIVGVELAVTMISKARAKDASLRLIMGRSEALPFQTGRFAGALWTFVHHHFSDLRTALSETHRALAPGGKLVILNATADQMEGYWLNAYFPQMMRDSIRQYEAFDTERALREEGFAILGTEPYEVREDLKDNFMYSGKYRPEIYLDPAVRAGISGFASSSNASEIEQGCARLAQDIATGKISEIVKSYSQDRGDYLFIAAERR
jgi:ubiquinone/menaquinone biosynthesis C-methylase UbiE